MFPITSLIFILVTAALQMTLHFRGNYFPISVSVFSTNGSSFSVSVYYLYPFRMFHSIEFVPQVVLIKECCSVNEKLLVSDAVLSK